MVKIINAVAIIVLYLSTGAAGAMIFLDEFKNRNKIWTTLLVIAIMLLWPLVIIAIVIVIIMYPFYRLYLEFKEP